MALTTVNVTLRGDVNGIELDEMWWGSVGWDFENLEVGLADGWFAN